MKIGESRVNKQRPDCRPMLHAAKPEPLVGPRDFDAPLPESLYPVVGPRLPRRAVLPMPE